MRHTISNIWNFQVISAFVTFTETSFSLSCIVTYHSPLDVLTLKAIPIKMSSTRAGKVDSFKDKTLCLVV